MTTINQPRVTVSLVNASQTVQNTGHKVLLCGQKRPAGTATNGQLYQNIANDNTYISLFGEDSQLAHMIRAFKRVNQATRIDAIGVVDNGSATSATKEIAITGPATEAGTLTVVVGSQYDYSFDIAVTNGATATAIGNLIQSAVNAATDCPYTAANVTGTVTLTAVNGGEVASLDGFAVFGSVAGVSIAFASVAGTNDPNVTSILDAIGDERYQGIVWPWASDTAPLKALLDARFNVAAKVLDGVGFVPYSGTVAEVTSQITENSPSIVYLVDDKQTSGDIRRASQLEFPYAVASAFAGMRARRLDASAQPISDIVISTYGNLDAFGGPALASKPYFNTPLAYVDTVPVAVGYSDTEVEQLADDVGASCYGNNIANTAVVFGEIITTYRTDSAGNPDETWKYLEYVDTASQCREYFYNNLRARFAQSRLTEGDTIPGRDMANAAVIIGECVKLYQDLSGPDFVLLESGDDALSFFRENLVVTINKQTGTASIQRTVPLVTQLRTINATMKIAFSTNA